MTGVLGNRNGTGNRTDARQRFSNAVFVVGVARGWGVAARSRVRAIAGILGNRPNSGSTDRGVDRQKVTPPIDVVGAAHGVGSSHTTDPVAISGGYILPTPGGGSALGHGVATCAVTRIVPTSGAALGVGRSNGLQSPLLRLGPLDMVAQETGVFSAYTPTNFGAIQRVNQTEVLGDVFAADQGRQWETGDGRVLIMYGDAYGAYWTGPFNTQQDVSHLATVSGAHPAVNSTNYDGTATITITGNGFAFQAAGMVTIFTGGTQWEGWASFSYTSRDATHFYGVKWLNGNGNLSLAANAVSSGDPRGSVASFFRHNVFAYSSDTDIRDGYTLDSFIEASAGSKVAREVISYSPAASNDTTTDWIRAFPDAGLAIADVRQAAYGFIVTTQAAHGITADNPYVYLEGLDPTETTTVGAAKNGFDVSGFTSVDFEINSGGLAFNNASGSLIYVPTHGGNPSDGGYAILSYTSRTSNKFQGVVRQSGSGTLVSGDTIRQGMYDVADSYLVGPTDASEKDWLVKQVISPTVVYIETGLDAVIGVAVPNQGALRKARNPYDADPTSAPVISVGPSGGIGFAAATPSGVRQVATFQRFLYVGWHTSYLSATSLAYSDDVGETWTEVLSAVWSVGASFSEPAPQFPILPGDGYLYLFTGPSLKGATCVARCLLADFTDVANWRYWDGVGWNTDREQSVALWQGSMAEAPYIIYHEGQKVWIATYQDGSSQIWVRFSSTLIGPWSTPSLVASLTSFTPNDLPYGPKIHPYSGRPPNDPAILYFTITLYNAYTTFLMSTLVGPWDIPNSTGRGVGRALAAAPSFVYNAPGASKGFGTAQAPASLVITTTGTATGSGVARSDAALLLNGVGDARGWGTSAATIFGGTIIGEAGDSRGEGIAACTTVSKLFTGSGSARCQGVASCTITQIAIVSGSAVGMGTAHGVGVKIISATGPAKGWGTARADANAIHFATGDARGWGVASTTILPPPPFIPHLGSAHPRTTVLQFDGGGRGTVTQTSSTARTTRVDTEGTRTTQLS